jgi:DNA mismatch repair protein MutS
MKRENSRTRSLLNVPVTSLLWPPGISKSNPPASQWEHDLGLNDLVQALSTDRRYVTFVRQTLAALNTDPDVIAWRQSVLIDLMKSPQLVERLQVLLPSLADLRQGHVQLGSHKRSLLLETADRLAELDVYISAVQTLTEALENASLDSDALRSLRGNLQALLNDPSFGSLREEMPALRAPLQHVASLTVGINLDSQLRPLSTVLLAINEHKMTEPSSLLSRLIGLSADPDDESGIAPLHSVPDDPAMRPLSVLFQDLDQLLTRTAQPVARALGRYVKINSGPLVGLENEFAFYVAAVALIKRLQQQGITFCRPEIAPAEERITQIDGLMNINLALRRADNPVPSDARFDADGRIAILTGPNSGGKTTYVQGVGLAHVLFQAGLLIPARQARISPVDMILTHFPALETRQEGRLAEEALRLREVFQRATPQSLVLLNESLTSTAFSEALYLAQDILAALRSIGLRAIYATHLVELAEHISEIEASISGDSALFSLVAGIRETDDHAVPTFEIVRGQPLGRSYAREIARRYGIGLEQILRARGDNSN